MTGPRWQSWSLTLFSTARPLVDQMFARRPGSTETLPRLVRFRLWLAERVAPEIPYRHWLAVTLTPQGRVVVRSQPPVEQVDGYGRRMTVDALRFGAAKSRIIGGGKW